MGETRADNKRLAREKELLQEQVQKGASGDDARLELQKLRENYEKERAESQEAQAQAAQVMKEVYELQQQLREARLEAKKAQERAGVVSARSDRRDRRSLAQAQENNSIVPPDTAPTWC